jgi:hypothetical protein
MQSLDKILNAGLPPEIGKAADTVRDLTQRAVKAGADAANSAIGGISGFIQENSGKVIPKATEDLKQILEKAGDSVSAFKENFENSLLPEYKEKAGELYEQASELAGEGVTVTDVLQSWVEKATSLEGIASLAPSLADSIGAGVLSGADTDGDIAGDRVYRPAQELLRVAAARDRGCLHRRRAARRDQRHDENNRMVLHVFLAFSLRLFSFRQDLQDLHDCRGLDNPVNPVNPV